MKSRFKIILISVFLVSAIVVAAVLIWRLAMTPGVTPDVNQQLNGGLSSVDGVKTFQHPGYGFSFEYPKDWNVSSFSEGEGETILVQSSETGVQIYISPFDEPETALTKERILKDIPEMVINNDQPIKFAGLSALRFDSVSQSGQNTREVWFAHNGFLYQISFALRSLGEAGAVVGSEEVLNKMIETWKIQ